MPTPPSTPSPIDITTSALQVSGFTYVGNKTVTLPSGAIAVMEFSIADATFSSLTIKMPCSGHSQLVLSQAAAHATGNLTLDLTWFTATIGTTTLAYTPSSPPAAPPFSSGAGMFNAVSMVALAGAADQLSLQGTNQTAVAC